MLVDRSDREPLEAAFHYQSANTRMEEYRKRHDECVLRQDIFLNDSNQRSHSENSRLYQVYMENVEKKNISSYTGNQYPCSTLSNPNPSPSFTENGSRDSKTMVDSRTLAGSSAHNPSATGKMEWLETLSQYHNHLTTTPPNHAYTPPIANNATAVNGTYHQSNPSLGQDLTAPNTNFNGPNGNYQPDYANYSARYTSYPENGLGGTKISPPPTTPSNGSSCPVGFTPNNGYYSSRVGASEPCINGDAKNVSNIDYIANRPPPVRELNGGSLSSLLHTKTSPAQGSVGPPPVVAKRTYNTSASKLLAKTGLGLAPSQGQSSKEAKALAAKARKDQRRLLKAQKLLNSNNNTTTGTAIAPPASNTPNTVYKQRINSCNKTGSTLTSSQSPFTSPHLTDFNEPPSQGAPQQRKRRYNSNGAHSNRAYHQDQGLGRSNIDCTTQQLDVMGCDVLSMNAYNSSIGSSIAPTPCDSSNLALIPPSIFGPGGGSNQGGEGVGSGVGGLGNSSSQIQAFMDTYQISDDIMCNDAFQDILLGLEDLTDPASLAPSTAPNNLITYFGSPPPPALAQTNQAPTPSSPNLMDKVGSPFIRQTNPFPYNNTSPQTLNSSAYKTEFCSDKWATTATPRWNNPQQQAPFNGPYRNDNHDFQQSHANNAIGAGPLNNSNVNNFDCNYASTNNNRASLNPNSMLLGTATEITAKIPPTLPKKVGRKKMAPKTVLSDPCQPIGNGPDPSAISGNESLYGLKNIFNHNTNALQQPQKHHDSIFDYNASSTDYFKPNLVNTPPASQFDSFKTTSLCNNVKNPAGFTPTNNTVGGKRGKRSSKSLAPSSTTTVASTLTSVVEKYGPAKGSRQKSEATSRNKSTESDPYNYTNDCEDYDIHALNPNYRRYSTNNNNPQAPLPLVEHKMANKTSPYANNLAHYPPNNGTVPNTKYGNYPQYPPVQVDNKQCGWTASPRFNGNRGAMQNVREMAVPKSMGINPNTAFDGPVINYDSNASQFEPYRSQNHPYNNPYMVPGQGNVGVAGICGPYNSSKYFDNAGSPMIKHSPAAATVQMPFANPPCIPDKRLDCGSNNTLDQTTPFANVELDNALTEFLNSNDASIISGGNGSTMNTAPNSYNSNTSHTPQDQFNKGSPTNNSVEPIVDTFSQSPFTHSNQMTVEERNVLHDFAAAADFFSA